MIIVGKQKKAPKGWCVVRDALTGQIYNGYEPDAYVGNAEEVNRRASVSKKELEAYKTPLVRPEYPKDPWVKGSPAWDQYYKDNHAFAVYERHLRHSRMEGFEFGPVFRCALTFQGYSRGRSSVTMDFTDNNGFPIHIGPSGINMFIRGISEGKIQVDGKGRFVMQFVFSKKGANVYADPHYEAYDPLLPGDGK